MKRRMLGLALAVVAAGGAFGQLAVDPALPEKAWTHGMWLPRFDATRELAATGGCDVVFLGDSITHFWESKGAAVWRANFETGPYRALNCGFSGDRTEHVLWRLDHGQLAGANPKAVVLMIGTNNTGHRSAEEESATDTILGVQSVLERVARLCPAAKVVLHPIFPRGATTNDPLRVRNDLVNSVIRKFADGRRVLWCDFNSRLLTPDGVLTREMAPDLLHPGPAGYEIWAAALKPYLDYALGRTAKVPAPAAAPAPTAVVGTGKSTTTPEIKLHWLFGGKDRAEPRLRTKRAEECANAERYYDLIMLGDSITHFWERKAGAGVFRRTFGAYRTLNLGFGGDRVQNVLWNIRHGGALDGVHARVITLMVGTNNTWSDSAEDIAEGIAACVKEIRAKQPQATLLLMPILPREVARKRGDRDFRRKSPVVDEILPKQQRVNELIRPLADGRKVRWFDLTAKFTDADGLPDVALLGDGTHPNEAGYEVWAAELLPILRDLIRK